MPTGAIVLAAVAGVVMALIARARANDDDQWYHKDWAHISSKDNLLPVEQNNIGIGLMLYKLDEFINNQTTTAAADVPPTGCNEAMLNTETYDNKVEKSCCKATGNSIAELTDTIKETQAQTQLQMEVLLLAVSSTMESVRTITQLVRDHLIKDRSRHGKDGRKKSHRNEVVAVGPDCKIKRGCRRLGGSCMKESKYCGGTSFIGKQYCSRRTCKCCVTSGDIGDYIKNNGKSIYGSKRPYRNKGNEIVKTPEYGNEIGQIPSKGGSYPPRKVVPSTTNKKDKTENKGKNKVDKQSKVKDKVNKKEKENIESIKEDEDEDIDDEDIDDESKLEKYRLLSESHTALLPPKPFCNITKTGISEEEKIEIMKLHNDLRSQVALGQEQRGAPGPQPEAANMREIVWNDELQEIGQAWASQCPSDHDCKTCRKMLTREYDVGQNIYEQWTNNFKPPQMWASAVNGWYNEVKDLPNEYVKSFQPVPPSGAKIGHYTQVAWSETNEIGCGAIIFHTVVQGRQAPASKKYVCNYGPSGNYLETEMYIIGPAASQCSNGISDNYPALCK